MAHYSLAPNLTGQKFGLWTVIQRNGSLPYGGSGWLCRCECGTERTIAGGTLRRGQSQSCGCAAIKKLVARSTKHGLHNHPLYRAWNRMKERCYQPKHEFYSYYGGRGISVCERWQQFEAFYADNIGTWNPKLTLDRIDNDGPYSPGNCRWATRKTQSRNRSNSVRIEFNGRTQLLVEWAEQLNIQANVLRLRRKNGWSTEEVLTIPYGGKRLMVRPLPVPM